MEGDVVPGFSNSLIGVKPFEYSGCIIIFHPQQGGVKIHHQEDVHNDFLSPPIIKGVREEAELWKFTLNNYTIPDGKQHYFTGRTQTDPHTDTQSHLANDTPKDQAHNVYELLSISQGIKWVHDVCRYPVKPTWLKKIRAIN